MKAFPVPDQRIYRGVAASLSARSRSQDGEPVAFSGAPTVSVTAADGTLITSGTATGTDPATFALSAAQTADLDVLTVTWTDGSTVITTVVEIVGAVYFTVADARAFGKPLDNSTDFPDAKILDYRAAVESEAEAIMRRAFVPKYRHVTLTGRGVDRLLLPDDMIRSVRSIGEWDTDKTVLTAYAAGDLVALSVESWGAITRTNGGVFTSGDANVVVGYEYGADGPPRELKEAMLLRLRTLLAAPRSGISDRALSFTDSGGTTTRLATAGMAGWETGIPDVDAVYKRLGRDQSPGFA